MQGPAGGKESRRPNRWVPAHWRPLEAPQACRTRVLSTGLRLSGLPLSFKAKRHRPSIEKRPSCKNNHPTTTASGAKGIMASSESDFMQKSGESIWLAKPRKLLLKRKPRRRNRCRNNEQHQEGLTIQLKKYWLIFRF